MKKVKDIALQIGACNLVPSEGNSMHRFNLVATRTAAKLKFCIICEMYKRLLTMHILYSINLILGALSTEYIFRHFKDAYHPSL